MIKINKNQLPSMRENGSVENTKKYTIAECEPRGLRLKDLAEQIASQLDTHFILYDYKGKIYTDNENVIQILKDEYSSGDYPAYSNPTEGFSYDNMNIEWDSLLQLQENGNYQWVDYKYVPKWYYIYRKLAEQLDRIDTLFSDKSKGKQLYEKCFGNQEFRSNNEWIEKFDSEWKVKSLDPIHIFASLNNNKLGNDKRIKRINILFRILDDHFQNDYRDINFDGCPAPMTINIIGARDEDTQEEVWSIFDEIMHKSQESAIDFSKIQEWYGVNIGAFTIFLFWIDAKNFLPLDKNTVALLEEYNKLNTFPTIYQDYKELLSLKETNLYLLLALVSYDNKKQELLNREDKEKIFNYLEIEYSKEKPSIEESNKFKLISIQPLKGCNEKYLKTLKEEVYLFDKAYSIHDKIIEINNEKDVSLFDLDNINININAIVGKNGTGKSTIVELLFAIINNISFEKKINADIIKINNLRVELIFESLHIYKITINDNEIKILQYIKENNKYINPTELNISEFDFDKLFYTIAVNYSQHSLNSLYMGDWVHSLFHKNDAYQTPIVIEPYRKNGNININRQEVLIKQRLVTNLLLQEDSDNNKNSPRQLTEFYRAKDLKLSFNRNKIFYLTEKTNDITKKHIFKDEEKNFSVYYSKFKDNHDEILNTIYIKYNIREIEKIESYEKFETYSFEQKVHLYILKKLVSIAYRYKKYEKYFNKVKKNFNNLDEYVNKLYEDDSHIVYKLKQAINFLRFESIIEKKEDEQTVNIEKLSDKIEKIKQDNKEEKLTINELVPPSFFSIDIILDNGINFNSLSSGEKQKIYSVNSILYHINNINSVDNSLIQYKRVNIILDEIELYFHPELQRNYLSYLLHVISKANTNNILAVNILFVTHSPFILSDIPDSKILFLDKNSKDINSKTVPSIKEIKTFGANIHELLINGFFMNNAIGEFALKEIKTIVNFHHEVMSIKEEGLLKDKEKLYNDLKNRFYFIQEHIGEDYISGIIKNHLIDIEKKLNSNSFKTKRIEALKKELEDLQRDTNG